MGGRWAEACFCGGATAAAEEMRVELWRVDNLRGAGRGFVNGAAQWGALNVGPGRTTLCGAVFWGAEITTACRSLSPVFAHRSSHCRPGFLLGKL